MDEDLSRETLEHTVEGEEQIEEENSIMEVNLFVQIENNFRPLENDYVEKYISVEKLHFVLINWFKIAGLMTVPEL